MRTMLRENLFRRILADAHEVARGPVAVGEKKRGGIKDSGAI